MQPSTLDSRPSPHSDNEVLVRVEGVSKKFCRSLKKSLWYGVCDIAGELSPFGRRPQSVERQVSSDENLAEPSTHNHDGLRPGEFWAVNDVSFELRRGECLGLIGHNGAGKTTLLKMLNGLIKPDRGRIEMHGRVGALIALGAGFNPILTGRENIYINGAVLGLSKKEIDEKIDEIINFAEIGDFIDMPVQNYSSGMQVRLGFAIASSLSPDVLILDEVLAVGDIGFVTKCVTRMRTIASEAAVIFVSHHMQFVSAFCTRAIFMDQGQAVVNTPQVSEAVDNYFSLTKTNIEESGIGGARYNRIELKGTACVKTDAGMKLQTGSEAYLECDFEVSAYVDVANIHFTITNESMGAAACFPVHDTNCLPKAFQSGRHRIRVDLGKIELRSGKYDIVAILYDASSKQILQRVQGLAPFCVIDDKTHWGQVVRVVSASPLA
jgi:lipopolysaccharide transport system ATP-binding protein